MMNYSVSLGMIMFSLGILSLVSRFKHLLSMLLSLEMIMLSIMILLPSIMTPKGIDSSTILIFITLMVCEGSLGLAMLVAMSRLSGNSLINSTTIL